MITKYNHLTDKELIHLVRDKKDDLVEELCTRLERLVAENEILTQEITTYDPDNLAEENSRLVRLARDMVDAR